MRPSDATQASGSPPLVVLADFMVPVVALLPFLTFAAGASHEKFAASTGLALVGIGLGIFRTLSRIADRLDRSMVYTAARPAPRAELRLRAFPGETPEALGRSRP